jgi:hypothetical protein
MMTGRVEDREILDLLEALDEILQEEHDVEIAASASTIRSLLAERDALKAKVELLREALEHLDVGEGWAAQVARAALAQTSTPPRDGVE